MADTLHFFLGTKAQYIKTAPVIRELDSRGVAYRLIDSGQHGEFSVPLRAELGIREPDVALGSHRDVASTSHAVRWSIRLLSWFFRKRRLKEQVFAGKGGICIVHGDTPSTLIASILARRAGLDVAHIESGLRSYRLFHPFPEELIRIAVMRISQVLFAPDEIAVRNLERMRVRGTVIATGGNTTVDALVEAIDLAPRDERSGPAVVTCHRVENLTRRKRIEGLVELTERIASTEPTTFVLHPPTEAALRSHGLLDRLTAAGVETRPLLPHHEFVELIRSAPYVVTDGGSIQEECAILGVPTLLWRDATERSDGLDRNVVLSRYDREVVEDFLRDPQRLRVDQKQHAAAPSELIVRSLLELCPR